MNNAMGLIFDKPWDVLQYRVTPKEVAKKKKHGVKRSKAEQSMMALETEGERKARQENERNKRMANLLKNSPYSESGYNTGKTNSERAPR